METKQTIRESTMARSRRGNETLTFGGPFVQESGYLRRNAFPPHEPERWLVAGFRVCECRKPVTDRRASKLVHEPERWLVAGFRVRECRKPVTDRRASKLVHEPERWLVAGFRVCECRKPVTDRRSRKLVQRVEFVPTVGSGLDVPWSCVGRNLFRDKLMDSKGLFPSQSDRVCV